MNKNDQAHELNRRKTAIMRAIVSLEDLIAITPPTFMNGKALQALNDEYDILDAQEMALRESAKKLPARIITRIFKR